MKEHIEITNLMKRINKLNQESIRGFAEVYAKSDISDKTMIGFLINRISYGIASAEMEMFSSKLFLKENLKKKEIT